MMGSPRDFVWRANDGAWEMTDFRDFGCISPRFCAFSAGLHGFCTFFGGKCGKLTGVWRTIAAGGGSNTKTGGFDAMAESAGWMFWM